MRRGTSIDWQATPLPFAAETDDRDWIDWVVSRELQDEAAKLVTDGGVPAFADEVRRRTAKPG